MLGSAAVRSTTGDNHAKSRDAPSRKLRSIAPLSTNTTVSVMTLLSASAASATARDVAPRTASNHAAAEIASAGRTGTRKRAGVVYPAHHILNAATAAAYGASATISSIATRV